MPVALVAVGFAFNAMNGFINGTYLFFLSGGYPTDWLWDARFLAGLTLFIAGFVINRRADLTLRRLRAPGESGYKIPYGGLYHWVSCPNYLGEIVEWVGWAVATWSLPGLAFAIWTVANLAPRARAHHVWYHDRFPDYPSGRKALLPGVW
jgi:protein-S-isoprenylcysteine O-methyltransferase Ste14